jgi:hypothetical protein
MPSKAQGTNVNLRARPIFSVVTNSARRFKVGVNLDG